ncbi:serine hydrolase domain-containing protein [Spongiivirga sp. MCCC 1A20706]|uniref:serine hydrolase domain-containing protein n=1 Tax=Spongiivirga sp. MCCC 1A20706 TaxID=3160963 RepID=UPI003977459B
MIKLSCLLFLSVSFTSCYSQKKITNLAGYEVSTDSINEFIKLRMDSLNIPGLSIAVINDSKVVYHQTFGYANLEKKLPVTSNTIFEGASMSKSVFSTFVMTYVEDGKLDLDKPLYHYWSYPDIAHDERYKKITARMVLSHRSGFPNWRENEEDRKLKIKFDPGTSYEYSGEGYQYLAMVLKHIEGDDWNNLEIAFQKKIAKPLGMVNTTFIENDYALEHKAEPYNNEGIWIDWKNDYWYKKGKGKFVAPSSIRSESLDFSKWMIGVMDKKILTESSYSEILKRHSKMYTTSSGIDIYYTLGFVTIDNEEYRNTYLHGGTNDGFTCYYLMDTHKRFGYVLFTNSMHGEKLGNEVWNYLERKY